MDDGACESISGPYDICANDVDTTPAVAGNAAPPSTATETYDVQSYSDPDGDSLSWDWYVEDVGAGTEVTTGITDNSDGSIDIDWSVVGASDGDDYTIDCTITDVCEDVVATQLAVTITDCPSQIYDTTFDTTDPDKTEWSNVGSYWTCGWWTGTINSRNTACSAFDYYWYQHWAGRTNGFAVPSCWTSTPITLEMQHGLTQEGGWDTARLGYRINVPGNYYTTYLYTTTSGSVPTTISYFNLTGVGLTPGNTIYLWWYQGGNDSCCNDNTFGTGWTIYYMTID